MVIVLRQFRPKHHNFPYLYFWSYRSMLVNDEDPHHLAELGCSHLPPRGSCLQVSLRPLPAGPYTFGPRTHTVLQHHHSLPCNGVHLQLLGFPQDRLFLLIFTNSTCSLPKFVPTGGGVREGKTQALRSHHYCSHIHVSRHGSDTIR